MIIGQVGGGGGVPGSSSAVTVADHGTTSLTQRSQFFIVLTILVFNISTVTLPLAHARRVLMTRCVRGAWLRADGVNLDSHDRYTKSYSERTRGPRLTEAPGSSSLLFFCQDCS